MACSKFEKRIVKFLQNHVITRKGYCHSERIKNLVGLLGLDFILFRIHQCLTKKYVTLNQVQGDNALSALHVITRKNNPTIAKSEQSTKTSK